MGVWACGRVGDSPPYSHTLLLCALRVFVVNNKPMGVKQNFYVDWTRRDFLKVTGLATLLPIFKNTWAAAQTQEPIQWLAQVFSAYEQQVTEFQKTTGYQAVTTLKDQISTNQTLLTGGNETFDVVSNTCSFWIAAGATDDLYACLVVVEQGRRFVFEPRARAYIRT
ncbi:MAG: hypothetical protein L0Y56_08005, partial [Nitrospira sp.]|nr:hypothetical protein [Nitrospira sp.]